MKGWARDNIEKIDEVRREMVRFMQERHVDPLKYHEHMWEQLARLEEARLAAKNILDAGIKGDNGND